MARRSPLFEHPRPPGGSLNLVEVQVYRYKILLLVTRWLGNDQLVRVRSKDKLVVLATLQEDPRFLFA